MAAARRFAREVNEARSITREICAVNYLDFQRAGAVVKVPFAGLRSSFVSDRPPRELFYIGGRVDYASALLKVLVRAEDSKGVVIVGPKGSGKSCLLRALSVELISRREPHHRVLCLWYLDHLEDLALQVRNCLLFAYCGAGDDGIIGEVRQIESVDSLKEFIDSRKSEGNYIILLSDGEEKFDALRQRGGNRSPEETEKRAEARKWLDILHRSADLLVKTLSPGANESKDMPDGMVRYDMKTPLFKKDEWESFLETTVLGRMLKTHEDRRADILKFAGTSMGDGDFAVHPMSLFFMNVACESYLQEMGIMPTSNAKRRLGYLPRDPDTGKEIDVEVLGADAGAEEYLDDKEEWKAVLTMFQKGQPSADIQSWIKEYSGELEALRSPATVFRGYVMENGYFCSDYIYKVHLEAALERLKSRVFHSPAFVAHVKEKLSKPNLVWPEIGWACEGFVADAIMALGLQFLGKTVRPSDIEMLDGEAKQLKPEQLQRGQALYLLPRRYSFKYVDGLIVWVDNDGTVHILAIQVTVSPESHKNTEYKFMRRSEVQRWFAGPCALHYIYLCVEPTSAPASPRTARASGSSQTAGTSAGGEMVEYKCHELKLSNCFGDNLGHDEQLVLQKLAELRVEAVEQRKDLKRQQQQGYAQLLKSLSPSKQALYKRAKKQVGGARAWLESEAPKYGSQSIAGRLQEHPFAT